MQKCFADWVLEPGLISYWNKKQNTKSYLPANKYSGYDLNLSSHSNLVWTNFWYFHSFYDTAEEIKRAL